MLKKRITGILTPAMCASTLAALPQGARAAEPGESDEPEGQLECTSELPPEGNPVVTD